MNKTLLLAFAVAFAASELLYPLLFPWYFAATVHQVPAGCRASRWHAWRPTSSAFW